MMRHAVLLLTLVGLAAPVRGEVVDQAANGFYYPGGLDRLAPVVDTVLAHQAQLLKEHAEKAARTR